MDYTEAVAYLEGLSRFGIKPGLERTLALLDALGHPEAGLSAVHITGTNGKGSVAAGVASMASAAGYKVGLYTSPHLARFEERFQINGEPVSAAEFADLIGETALAAQKVHDRYGFDPTQFEVLTAAAFFYFARAKVDLAVIEVGLGGRYDATNVLAAPLVTVIAGIDLDHTEVLGNTTAAIARDKAGIARRGVPLVVGSVDASAWAAIQAVATETGAPVVRVQAGRGGRASEDLETVWFDHVIARPDGTFFDLHAADGDHVALHTALRGRHQAYNGAVAVAAAWQLRKTGVSISDAAIRIGLASVRWPGRLEIVRHDPLVVLDGAHNPGGARAAAAAIAELFPAPRPRRLVLGVLADKDVPGVVGPLVKDMDLVIAARPGSTRALAPEELARYVQRANPKAAVAVVPDIAAAIALGLDGLGADGLLVVAGSLYLVGPARTVLTSVP